MILHNNAVLAPDVTTLRWLIHTTFPFDKWNKRVKSVRQGDKHREGREGSEERRDETGSMKQ